MGKLFAAGRIRGIPTGTIRFLVDRLHVGRSNVDVIRELSNRMDRTEWTKERRKAAYRYAIAHHRHNFATYAYVMSGGNGLEGIASNLNRGE